VLPALAAVGLDAVRRRPEGRTVARSEARAGVPETEAE